MAALGQSYIPSTMESVRVNVPVFSRLVTFNLWDVQLIQCRPDDFNRLLWANYAKSSVVIICFAIDTPSSLESVEDRWIEQIKEFATHKDGWKPPVMLVGCKKDIRAELQELKKMQKSRVTECVSVDQGQEMAKRIDAAIYLECSAKTGEGVDDVLQHAARLALLAKGPTSN
ncbi:GTP-binding protein Rho1 [Serendipita sp. 399]|nr:GTP-binding protein Rho1 [Serendipita sp. 399]